VVVVHIYAQTVHRIQNSEDGTYITITKKKKWVANWDWVVNKLALSSQIFEKYSSTKFHENPSSGSRVVSCRRTETRDEAVVAIRNFAKAPKNKSDKYAIMENGC
jgi:hypothetical protein